MCACVLYIYSTCVIYIIYVLYTTKSILTAAQQNTSCVILDPSPFLSMPLFSYTSQWIISKYDYLELHNIPAI